MILYYKCDAMTFNYFSLWLKSPNHFGTAVCLISGQTQYAAKLPPPIECLCCEGICSDAIYSTVTATTCLTDGPASANIQNNLQTASG